MNSQSIIPDFWKTNPTQTTNTQFQLTSEYGFLPRYQTPDSSHHPHYTQKKTNPDVANFLGMMLGRRTIPK